MHLPIFSVLASIILTPTNFSRDVLAQPVDNETLHQATGVLKDHVTLLSDNSSHDPFIQIRADGLLRRGIEHFQSGRFHQALESWQSALELYRTINDRLGEARALGNSGVVYRNLGQYEQAIESLDQHLAIARELGNLTEEGKALAHLGNVYLDLVRYQQATELFEQSLRISREVGDWALEGIALSGLGNVYLSLNDYQKAIEFFEQDLVITRQSWDLFGEVSALGNLGIAYRNLGQYQRAIGFYEQSLRIAREIGDRAGEGKTLGNLGIAYRNLGQYQRAIEFHMQQLEIAQEVGDPATQGNALNNLGNVHLDLSQYQQAIEFYEQSLRIAREIGYWAGIHSSLGNLGVASAELGHYQQAIDFLDQQLIIVGEVGDRAGKANTLGNLGNVYRLLGQEKKAIEYYKKALSITREIGDRAGEGFILGNLGNVYLALNQEQKAIEYYEETLSITREIGDQAVEGLALGNLGSAYLKLGKYQQAANHYRQDLTIAREIGNRAEEGRALGNLAIVERILGRYQLSSQLLEQQLIITREINDRTGEGISLENLGILFETQQQLDLAILFYKQSINLRKQINQPLNDPVSRQSYLETVAKSYRRLENLLLEQGRQLEAQQVLELFKLQELSDYTNEQNLTTQLPDLVLLPKEEEVINTYNNLVTTNQQLRACNADNCANNGELQAAIELASEQHQLATEQLLAFIQNDGHQDHHLLRDNFFLTQANKIIAQQPDTVLIYPLVLDESLWLLWVTEDGINSQRISNVNQQTLTETISSFRAALEDRYSDLSDLQTHANQLYNWLIAPVETAVDNPSRLVLALDRNTRYIPIGALYDGQQYLVEKYNISTILAASLTDTEERAPVGTANIGILAAGVSTQYENFPALPNVPIELDNIVKDQNNSNDQLGIYSGKQLLDPDFTAQTLRNSLSNDTRFLHIATHGEFVSGNRYSSYLLMGNGEKLPLPEIADLGSALSGVHLAVLSACQTALGGADEEGLEIAGLGYYFFKSDVDAVMASLWNVNDSSTSQLMQAFYQTLSEGTEANPMTKAGALRTAQLSLLRSNEPGNLDPDRFRRIPKHPDDQPRPDSGLAHPYYWAPFILIGNDL